jgi:2-(3-amino-3-carboxypropyl)histidine synthase
LKITGYDIDLENVVKIINKNNYKRVVLQVPEGLKSNSLKIVEFLEKKTNSSIIISGDSCFGACDIIISELKNLDIDFVVQIGHVPIPNIKNLPINTLFINAMADFDVLKVVKKALPYLKGKKVGLVSTVQHTHTLNDIKKFLHDKKFNPLIGYGNDRINLKGQILGCNFSAASSIAERVDSFLFIGSGNFHPLGLILITNKPVIACDPYTKEVKTKELYDLKDMILRQRYGAIARSKDAKVFCILIGIKRGQQRINLAYEIKEKLSLKNKKSFIIASNHFLPAHLDGYRDIDCFVSTACPRIAIDDYLQYKIPIITPLELDILLGIRQWEDYQFDEIE